VGGVTLIRWLARIICWIFYRVDRAGAVPSEGPVLILPNHPNALLDPAVVWATAGRDVRFLAKSTLFAGAAAPILRMARAIPVYRRLDQGVDPSRNRETFAAVDAAFAEGSAVCIFPEGVSHSTGRLAELRTGAARMALSAERQGTAVTLVAAGLNFDRKTAFRSRAIVLYGRPFSLRAFADDEDEQAAVRRATEAIAAEIRRLLVEADPDADAAMVTRVERLYAAARGPAQSPQERIARRQAIAQGMERLRRRDQGRFAEISQRLRRYDSRLQRFGFRDRHLDWDLSLPAAAWFALRELTAALVLLPLAAAALMLFWVPYQLTGMLARVATRERDVAATAKVFIGAAVHVAWLLVLAGTAWWFGGPRVALVAAVMVPLVAVAGLFAFERESAVIETVRSWRMLRRAKAGTRARLREARSELADVLDETYGWLTALEDFRN
jgi:1-acyl-sn-glycerol-3-phosphate acyltransferase